MKSIRILPYSFRVSAAKEIVEALRKEGYDALRIYPDRGYIPKENHLIINWGCSHPPKWAPVTKLVNDFISVKKAVNKTLSFYAFALTGVSCPKWTIEENEALSWLEQGKCVLARTLTKGKSGEGIVIMESKEDFVPAALYTIYKPKKKEFRVHVFNGKVIDVQEKRKKKGSGVGGKVRSHGNGWVFCRKDITIPQEAIEESIKAVAALGLHFGGVDVIFNEKENKCYVLEVNSAPGITGTTVMKYVEAIKEMAAK